MPSFKSGFGVFAALLPVLYCGGLVYYFLHFAGSLEQAQKDGLGPTVLGLSVVCVLFCIPLLIKVVRLFLRPPPPSLGARPDAAERIIDADSVIARYRARHAAQQPAAYNPTPKPTPRPALRLVPKPSFGRKPH